MVLPVNVFNALNANISHQISLEEKGLKYQRHPNCTTIVIATNDGKRNAQELS